MSTTPSTPSFPPTWAVVELMGHAQIAGQISEQPVAGTNMLRIDVPEVPAGESRWEPACQAYTRYVGGSAIYAINPCTEAVARAVAAKLRQKPIDLYGTNLQERPALPAARKDDENPLDDNDDTEFPDNHDGRC